MATLLLRLLLFCTGVFSAFQELAASTAPDSPLDIHIKLLVVGMTGTGVCLN